MKLNTDLYHLINSGGKHGKSMVVSMEKYRETFNLESNDAKLNYTN